MLVLVTGGAGFIGSHTVRALLAQGQSVRVLDNFSSGHRENLAGLPIEILEGDIRDLEVTHHAMREVTHVIHLAAEVSVQRSIQDPLAAHAINITGLLHVLLAARAEGVRRLVFASSCAVYGDNPNLPLQEHFPPQPTSPYGVGKLAGENYCLLFNTLYGIETVTLRYFNVFGPRQDPHSEYAAVIPKFMRAVEAGQAPVIYGDGEQTRDFVAVENVAQANLLALMAPGIAGQVFNIATGQATSLNQLVQTLSTISDKPITPHYTTARAGDIRHSLADITAARIRMNYEPKINLVAGLTQLLNMPLT